MMSYELMTQILDESGITYAYDHFNGPIKEKTYIAYFEDDKVLLFADNVTYEEEPHFAVELYTQKKDRKTEKILTDLFTKYEVAWSGGISTYIDSEKMFQTVFYV